MTKFLRARNFIRTYIFGAGDVPCRLVDDVAVGLAEDGAFVERHDVLKQNKYILDPFVRPRDPMISQGIILKGEVSLYR